MFNRSKGYCGLCQFLILLMMSFGNSFVDKRSEEGRTTEKEDVASVKLMANDLVSLDEGTVENIEIHPTPRVLFCTGRYEPRNSIQTDKNLESSYYCKPFHRAPYTSLEKYYQTSNPETFSYSLDPILRYNNCYSNKDPSLKFPDELNYSSKGKKVFFGRQKSTPSSGFPIAARPQQCSQSTAKNHRKQNEFSDLGKPFRGPVRNSFKYEQFNVCPKLPSSCSAYKPSFSDRLFSKGQYTSRNWKQSANRVRPPHLRAKSGGNRGRGMTYNIGRNRNPINNAPYKVHHPQARPVPVNHTNEPNSFRQIVELLNLRQNTSQSTTEPFRTLHRGHPLPPEFRPIFNTNFIGNSSAKNTASQYSSPLALNNRQNFSAILNSYKNLQHGHPQFPQTRPDNNNSAITNITRPQPPFWLFSNGESFPPRVVLYKTSRLGYPLSPQMKPTSLNSTFRINWLNKTSTEYLENNMECAAANESHNQASPNCSRNLPGVSNHGIASNALNDPIYEKAPTEENSRKPGDIGGPVPCRPFYQRPYSRHQTRPSQHVPFEVSKYASNSDTRTVPYETFHEVHPSVPNIRPENKACENMMVADLNPSTRPNAPWVTYRCGEKTSACTAPYRRFHQLRPLPPRLRSGSYIRSFEKSLMAELSPTTSQDVELPTSWLGQKACGGTPPSP